ncbi:MAG: hypothetical protein DRG24_00210 [Epsilonproteobacteria bacterium]|nr:MAG: hypothetical protein DRG24_00210 [Campylobacterota bacterium]
MKSFNFKLLIMFLGPIMLLLMSGCGSAKLSPAQLQAVNTKEVLYTQRGMWYLPKRDYFVVTATNYAAGEYLPPNTEVTVDQIKKNILIFSAGEKTFYLYNVTKYTQLDTAGLYDRMLSPRPVDMSQFTVTERKSMENGLLVNGMSKEAVLVSRGYPPVHKTPSIDADEWVYWNSRGYNYPLVFKNNKVSMSSNDVMNYAILGVAPVVEKVATSAVHTQPKVKAEPKAVVKSKPKPQAVAKSKPKPKPVVKSKPKAAPIVMVSAVPVKIEADKTNLDTYLAKKSTAPDPKKYALIFGIRTYDRQADVPYADNSARSFHLMAENVLGIPTENIFMLINEKATSGRIKANIALVAELAERGDTVYFFFAGHGVPGIDGNTYILPSDMTADTIHLEPKLKLDAIYARLALSQASRLYVFIDSCFSGRDDKGEMIYRGAAPVFKKKKQHFTSHKLTVMTAGSADDFANQYERQEQRLFSYYLIKAYADEKYNKNIDTLYDYVRRNVKRESLRIGLGYKQIPQLQEK